MRTRITLAILAVVVGTLILTGTGSVILTERAATTTAQSELLTETQNLAGALSGFSGVTDSRLLKVLQTASAFDALDAVGLSGSGQFSTLPNPITVRLADIPALQAGNTVAGNAGHEVFILIPMTLDSTKLAGLGVPTSDQAVLIATRHVKSPASGIAYFLLVAAAVLLVAGLVASYLARRVSAPLVRAVATTQAIAAGDLEAQVPVNPHDYPELTALADAINAMSSGLSRSKGLERQFLLSISHELRTPLTSIRGYADAIADGATDDVPAAVAVISAEARRLERLVQDLLDLARLDAQRFSLDLQRVDCAALVSAVADRFRPQAGTLGLELVLSLPPTGELWVDVDQDRLTQVAANLVENACKFATSRIILAAGQIGTSTAVWVVDDGPGIGADDLPHVFERHFRSDRTPTRRIGTGLGLFIVAELAAAMSAVVKAESPVDGGRGTRMVVWLRPQGPPGTTAGPTPPPGGLSVPPPSASAPVQPAP